MDIYGNVFPLVKLFITWQSPPFVYAFFIISYFNLKHYLVYNFLWRSGKRINKGRKVRLVLLSIINLLHIFVYFLNLEQIIQIDFCCLLRLMFLLVEV